MPFKLTMTSSLIWCKFDISKFNVFSKAMKEHPFKTGLVWIDRKVHTDGERDKNTDGKRDKTKGVTIGLKYIL